MADNRCKRKCPYQSNGWCIVESGNSEVFARWRICAIALRKEEPLKPQGRPIDSNKNWAKKILDTLALYPNGLTSNELAGMLGTSPALIRNYTTILTRQRKVVKRLAPRVGGKEGYPANLYFLTEVIS